jgi:hypothetical protein
MIIVFWFLLSLKNCIAIYYMTTPPLWQLSVKLPLKVVELPLISVEFLLGSEKHFLTSAEYFLISDISSLSSENLSLKSVELSLTSVEVSLISDFYSLMSENLSLTSVKSGLIPNTLYGLTVRRCDAPLSVSMPSDAHCQQTIVNFTQK